MDYKSAAPAWLFSSTDRDVSPRMEIIVMEVWTQEIKNRPVITDEIDEVRPGRDDEIKHGQEERMVHGVM